LVDDKRWWSRDNDWGWNIQKSSVDGGRREERGRLKEGDVSRDKVPFKCRSKTTISFLEARITKKNTLKGLGKEFIFT